MDLIWIDKIPDSIQDLIFVDKKCRKGAFKKEQLVSCLLGKITKIWNTLMFIDDTRWEISTLSLCCEVLRSRGQAADAGSTTASYGGSVRSFSKCPNVLFNERGGGAPTTINCYLLRL